VRGIAARDGKDEHGYQSEIYPNCASPVKIGESLLSMILMHTVAVPDRVRGPAREQGAGWRGSISRILVHEFLDFNVPS
jgi:hypothetical protein